MGRPTAEAALYGENVVFIAYTINFIAGTRDRRAFMTAEIDLCDAILDILRFIFKKYGAKVRLFREPCKYYFKKNFNMPDFF